MGHTTFINFRKPIVMIKTFYYYVMMILFPMKLGLFHTWGYTYDEKTESMDKMFWKGALIALIFISLIILAPFPIKFGLIWFVLYLSMFLNFITAQQFVVDRYLFIPSLGFNLIFAYLLKDFPHVYYVLVGLYMMRSFIHIRTFDHEIAFYQSNISNFPDSEVAWGNLGVAFSHIGWHGTAFDAWRKSASLNEFYSVPHYNLYNILKVSGDLNGAMGELKKCLNSKVVQYNDDWQKEYDGLKFMLEFVNKVNYFIKEAHYESRRNVGLSYQIQDGRKDRNGSQYVQGVPSS